MATTEIIENSSSEKEPKTPPSSAPPPSSQEPSPALSAGMAPAPDSSGFQAYSPMPPPGFVPSSPQPHPYMLGAQHMMPAYGSPNHPYVAMYPPGGMYAQHPSMPPGSYPYGHHAMPSPNGMTDASGNNTTGGSEDDAKQSDVKEKLPIKRSRGSLGSLNMVTGNNNEPGKNSGTSANGAYSKSGESVSDGSSEGSEANSQNDSRPEKDGKDASENGCSANGHQNGSVGTPPLLPISQTVPIMPTTAGSVPGPPTNLNIGMDYCGTPASVTIPRMRGGISKPLPGVVTPGLRDGGRSQPWPQDDRELKRQRRKQSNREAAQRSRLRKQAEIDELVQRAEAVFEENRSLREEVDRLKSRCEELTSEVTSLKDHLLSFPPLEGINTDNDDQEPDTNQAGVTERKVDSYKASTIEDIHQNQFVT